MPTFAKVTDPERAARWREVFGTDEVQVLSPVPSRANLPGFDVPQLVYLLDFSAVTPEARAKLVKQTGERFAVDTAVVDADLEREGMPILAEHVIVTCTDMGVLMSLMDDDPSNDNDWLLYDDIDDWPGDEEEDW